MILTMCTTKHIFSHEQTRNGTRTKALESAALFDAREKRTIPQNGGRILPNGMEMWRIVRSLGCERGHSFETPKEQELLRNERKSHALRR